MTTLWRISDHVDLRGIGGESFSSRWSRMGRRVVYLAESPAGALLEILAHLEFVEGELPDEFQLLEILVPDGLTTREIEPPPVSDWRKHPESTRIIGSAWLNELETPLARIPSAIMPRTWNCMLNPKHPDASQVRVVSVIRERFDNRLFHF